MAMRLNLCLGNLHKKLHTGVFELVVGLGFWLIYHIRFLVINSKLDVKLRLFKGANYSRAQTIQSNRVFLF